VREDINGNIFYDNDLIDVVKAEKALQEKTGRQTKHGSKPKEPTKKKLLPGLKSVKKDEGTFDQNKRGSIQLPNDFSQDPTIINLLKDADLSTFLHESGHFFFEVYRHVANQTNAPALVRDDMFAMLQICRRGQSQNLGEDDSGRTS